VKPQQRDQQQQLCHHHNGHHYDFTLSIKWEINAISEVISGDRSESVSGILANHPQEGNRDRL
jgi:hypothetical protein